MKCSKCKFYYVSWDVNAPHGCRAYKFKSKQMPFIAVNKISEKTCQLFMEKSNRKKDKEKDDLDLNRDDLW